MLVDSHCHLDQLNLEPYGNDLDQVLKEAKEHDVGHMLCVCIDMGNFPDVLKIAKQYDNVTASVGVHPNVQDQKELSVEEILELADDPTIVAIGETGLDYYRSIGEVEWQRDRFRRHISASKEINKSLIIHTRQAAEDTLKIMKEEGADKIGGVMHCFGEDWEVAKRAMDLNFYISFSGIVTFKNAKALHEVAQKVPLDRMLIETDAPYLAPTPHRGKPNVPAYVKLVAERIAELRDISYEEVAKHTTMNFFDLFQA